MWKPVGPLPASVYWRRRLVALGSAFSVLVLLGWAGVTAATALVGDGTTTRPTSRAALSAPQQTASSAASSATSSAASATGSQPSSVARPGSAAQPEVGVAVSGGLRPDETLRSSSPVPTPAAVPPTGPVPCANDMLRVEVEVEQPVHRVGERPLLRLVVTNTSEQPCVRDLDPARQEIVVWSADGEDRLWSSNDCSSAAGVDLRTLVPGQPVASSVRWVGRTSEPGCPEARSMVAAGTYRVLSRVDDVISEPAVMRRR